MRIDLKTGQAAARPVVVIAAALLGCALTATPGADAADRLVDCLVESGGKVEFKGKCRFFSADTSGSFALNAADGKSRLYGEILDVSVFIVAPGEAEVRGLTAHGIKVETLPSIEELTSGRVRVSRIRPVEVQDLLGRDPVDLDSVGIRKLVEGRVVLVTGAGGSIGGELCRQIAALNPRRLLMVEQAEGSLFNIEQELNDLGLGAIALPLIGDVLDRERMEFIFARHRPHVVFHAAAHKHVYLMERQPAEAIRNNVLGTRLLARVAAAQGVEAFVFISTDKAINPTSVMGATKRLAEIQLMAIAAGQGTGTDGGGQTTEDGGRTTEGGHLTSDI